MAALARAETATFRRSPVEFLRATRTALAVGAVCALAAAPFWLERPARPSASVAQKETMAVVSRALEAELPDRAEVQKWLTKVDSPLENEMGLVVLDAKTALGSLVASLRTPAGQ
jgi:hypothetical protein